jgi:hypothetical protein
MAEKEGLRKPRPSNDFRCLSSRSGHIDRQRFFDGLSSDLRPGISFEAELISIASAIERLGCRMGEDPERAILRKEALADRVRAVAAQIGGAA